MGEQPQTFREGGGGARRRDPVYSVYTNIGASDHPPQPPELRAIEPSHPVVVATTEQHPDPPTGCQRGGKREARGWRQEAGGRLSR